MKDRFSLRIGDLAPGALPNSAEDTRAHVLLGRPISGARGSTLYPLLVMGAAMSATGDHWLAIGYCLRGRIVSFSGAPTIEARLAVERAVYCLTPRWSEEMRREHDRREDLERKHLQSVGLHLERRRLSEKIEKLDALADVLRAELNVFEEES